MSNNHEDFGHTVATYLTKLYGTFPEPDYITPKDLGIDIDQWGNDAERAAAAAHWLLDKGFVRGDRHTAGVMLVVLAPKGQRLLEHPSGYGNTWVEALQSGDKAIQEAFRQAIVAVA